MAAEMQLADGTWVPASSQANTHPEPAAPEMGRAQSDWLSNQSSRQLQAIKQHYNKQYDLIRSHAPAMGFKKANEMAAQAHLAAQQQAFEVGNANNQKMEAFNQVKRLAEQGAISTTGAMNPEKLMWQMVGGKELAEAMFPTTTADKDNSLQEERLTNTRLGTVERALSSRYKTEKRGYGFYNPAINEDILYEKNLDTNKWDRVNTIATGFFGGGEPKETGDLEARRSFTALHRARNTLLNKQSSILGTVTSDQASAAKAILKHMIDKPTGGMISDGVKASIAMSTPVLSKTEERQGHIDRFMQLGGAQSPEGRAYADKYLR